MTSTAGGGGLDGGTHPVEEEPQAAPARARGSTVQRWLGIVGGLLLFGLLLTRVSAAEFADALKQAHLGQLALALLPALLATVFRTVRFGVIYPPRGRWLDTYGMFALLRPFSYVLPFHSGEIVSLGLLKQRGLAPPITETSAAWLLIRLSDLVALGLLLLLTLTMQPSPGDARWDVAGRVAAAVLAIALVGGALVFGGWRRFGPRLTGDGKSWLARRARAFDRGVSIVASPGVIGSTLAISLLVWTSQLATRVIVLLAFEHDVPAAGCALAATLAMAIALLPIRAPLGLGTTDAAWSAALVLVGLPLSTAVVLALANRLVMMTIIALDGVIGLSLTLGRTAQQGT